MTNASLQERVYDALRAAKKKALADEFADAFPFEIPSDRPYRNAWDSNPADVDPDYCPECERLLPWHYDNCTPAGRAAATAAVSNTTTPSQLGTNERIQP